MISDMPLTAQELNMSLDGNLKSLLTQVSIKLWSGI